MRGRNIFYSLSTIGFRQGLKDWIGPNLVSTMRAVFQGDIQGLAPSQATLECCHNALKPLLQAKQVLPP